MNKTKWTVAGLAVGGFLLGCWWLIAQGEPSSEQAANPKTHSGIADRSELAQAPMPSWNRDDLKPAEKVEPAPATVTLPPGSNIDDLGVTTGLNDKTPAHATAQLAAIWRTAWGTADTSYTQQVIDAWSLPSDTKVDIGAVRDMERLANSMSKSSTTPDAIRVVWVPRMAQVKGTVGKNFVVTCVLGHLQVTHPRKTTFPAGTCQSMVYQKDRWVIDATHRTATPPFAWPLSATAYSQGWKKIQFEGNQ